MQEMSALSYVEKEQMADLFGIKNGYVFSYLLGSGYNKNKTKEMIFEATGIDIYTNPNYNNLSQERCIRKIWEECDDYSVGCLLKTMLDYYYMLDLNWDRHDELLYHSLRELEKKLIKNPITIPATKTDSLKMIKDDIERNCNNNTPELALDRLHTYSTYFFRNICKKHEISTVDDHGKEIPLHSLVGMLKKWYVTNDYFESDFAVFAIQNTISIFEKFNQVRNYQSAAHPNDILNKAEAFYAIRIISETLDFVDKIEKIKDKEECDLPL